MHSKKSLEDDFVNPPEGEEIEEQLEGEEAEFENPQFEGEFAESAEEGIALDVGDELAQIHEMISARLEASDQEPATVEAFADGEFNEFQNIVGVAYGLGESDGADILEPGGTSLDIYVAEPMSADAVRESLIEGMGIAEAASEEIPMNVIVTGMIDAQPHRFKIRPAPGGVSVGHHKITAGTLGCLCTGRRAPRNRRLMMLSNNHVLANSNNARFGDSILQPGRYDGGKNPTDRVAILERFVPIRFGGPSNYVDAATGWCWHELVRRELIYRRSRGFGLFRISSQVKPARVGMTVGKTGRTTQLRRGRVTGIGATIRVNYGGGKVATCRDQVAIRGIGSLFSQGGDSGSVVWTWDRNRFPVGLLFAGGGGYTFANQMWRVVRALDIRLIT